jgi:hypothetical protein
MMLPSSTADTGGVKVLHRRRKKHHTQGQGGGEAVETVAAVQQGEGDEDPPPPTTPTPVKKHRKRHSGDGTTSKRANIEKEKKSGSSEGVNNLEQQQNGPRDKTPSPVGREKTPSPVGREKTPSPTPGPAMNVLNLSNLLSPGRAGMGRDEVLRRSLPDLRAEQAALAQIKGLSHIHRFIISKLPSGPAKHRYLDELINFEPVETSAASSKSNSATDLRKTPIEHKVRLKPVEKKPREPVKSPTPVRPSLGMERIESGIEIPHIRIAVF